MQVSEDKKSNRENEKTAVFQVILNATEKEIKRKKTQVDIFNQRIRSGYL